MPQVLAGLTMRSHTKVGHAILRLVSQSALVLGRLLVPLCLGCMHLTRTKLQIVLTSESISVLRAMRCEGRL